MCHHWLIMTPPKSSAVKQSGAPSDDAPLLTVAGIRALKADYDADVRLYEELPARIEQKKARLEAALLFAPKGWKLQSDEAIAVVAPLPVARVVRGAIDLGPKKKTKKRRIIKARMGKLTWTAAILAALNKADAGLTHKELKAKIEKTELASRLAASDKGFYGGIGKLSESGELVKSGGLLYSQKVAEALRRSGKALPDKTAESRQRGSTALVMDVIRRFPAGLSPNQLKELVAANPEAPKSIREHGQYIYNILAPLVSSGQVLKENGLYRPAGEIGEANGVTSTVGLGAHASGMAH